MQYTWGYLKHEFYSLTNRSNTYLITNLKRLDGNASNTDEHMVCIVAYIQGTGAFPSFISFTASDCLPYFIYCLGLPPVFHLLPRTASRIFTLIMCFIWFFQHSCTSIFIRIMKFILIISRQDTLSDLSINSHSVYMSDATGRFAYIIYCIYYIL